MLVLILFFFCDARAELKLPPGVSLTTTPAIGLLYPRVTGDFGSKTTPFNNHVWGGGVVVTGDAKLSRIIPSPIELDVGAELGVLSFPGALKDSNVNGTGLLTAPLRLHLMFAGMLSVGGGIYWSHLYGVVPANTFRRIDDFGLVYGGQISPFPTSFISPVIEYRYLYGLLPIAASGSAKFRGQQYMIGMRIGAVSSP